MTDRTRRAFYAAVDAHANQVVKHLRTWLDEKHQYKAAQTAAYMKFVDAAIERFNGSGNTQNAAFLAGLLSSHTAVPVSTVEVSGLLSVQRNHQTPHDQIRNSLKKRFELQAAPITNLLQFNQAIKDFAFKTGEERAIAGAFIAGALTGAKNEMIYASSLQLELDTESNRILKENPAPQKPECRVA